MVAHKVGGVVLLALALTGATSASAPSGQIQLWSVFAPRIDRTDLAARHVVLLRLSTRLGCEHCSSMRVIPEIRYEDADQSVLHRLARGGGDSS